MKAWRGGAIQKIRCSSAWAMQCGIESTFCSIKPDQDPQVLLNLPHQKVLSAALSNLITPADLELRLHSCEDQGVKGSAGKNTNQGHSILCFQLAFSWHCIHPQLEQRNPDVEQVGRGVCGWGKGGGGIGRGSVYNWQGGCH